MIRPAQVSDAPALLSIYEPAVRESIATFEIEPPSLEEMERRVASVTARYPWLVFEADGHVVGYAYATEYHPRAAYALTCEVSVYVAEAARGTGAGTALLRELLEGLAAAGFVNVLARIALPNESSVRLFEGHGFVHNGTARGVGFKLGRWIDVGEWQLKLAPS